METDSVQFDGALTIAKAELIHQQIEEHLRTANELVIDATNVERADTAILQILSSIASDESGIQLKLKASEGLKDCIQLLGLKTLQEKFV